MLPHETLARLQGVSKTTLRLCDVLVHLNGTPEDEIRITHAEALSAIDNARITGLLTTKLPDTLYFTDGPAFEGSDLDLRIRQESARTFEKLSERFRRLSVPNEVRKVEEAQTFLNAAFAREALWSDLTVVSTPYSNENASCWDSLVEAAMFDGAHGVYMIPYGIAPRKTLRSIVICWNGTREAARAITEALPFLSHATHVSIVCVHNVDTAQIDGPLAMLDIARHLASHGIEADIQMLESSVETAETLLNEAHRVSADLLVMGAFGHSRFREWLIGGTTIDLFRKSDLPILAAR